MTEAEILASLVRRIEAVREEKKLLSGSERDLFAEAKGKNIDGKALRRVLQRRAMDDADREAFDDLVDQYELALAGKALAAAALKAGATVREAATKGGISVGAAHAQKTKISEHKPSIGGSTPPQPAGNDAPRSSSAAASPLVETETDRAGNDDGAPEGPGGEEPPRPEPDDWQQRDAAGNYGVAYGAIRERHVASGAARLDAGDIPAFLDRRGRA